MAWKDLFFCVLAYGSLKLISFVPYDSRNVFIDSAYWFIHNIIGFIAWGLALIFFLLFFYDIFLYLSSEDVSRGLDSFIEGVREGVKWAGYILVVSIIIVIIILIISILP